MKKVLTFCAATILLACCGSLEHNNKILTYKNIVILSDLSSRIDNKPTKDIIEIHKLIQFFRNECVKPGRKIGDKSCIFFSAFSEKQFASIDIDRFKTLGEKQQFINSTGKYLHTGLEYEIDDFERKVKNAYSKTRNKGLDLLSILIEKIDNDPIIKNNKYLIDGNDTTFINYDNHIYIFTDGYLEYVNKNANSQFYFGISEIGKVRQYCIDEKLDIMTALEANKLLGLPANKSDRNKYINLHILETHERDKNEILQTYKYPRGQRDNEILEAVWRKWAIESGFKSFEWKKY